MSAPATCVYVLEMFRMKSIPARADLNMWQCGYSRRAPREAAARDARVVLRCRNRRAISRPRRKSTRRLPMNLDRRSCGFPGGANVAMIIYNGAIGPYESHEDVDQIYFVRHGTAKAAYDGRLVNPTVTTPGQIRGTGYLDASEYTIAPGDIVWIPRNQLHFVDPGTGKIGYFLIGMPSSQSGFPEPPSAPGGRGGRGGQ